MQLPAQLAARQKKSMSVREYEYTWIHAATVASESEFLPIRPVSELPLRSMFLTSAAMWQFLTKFIDQRGSRQRSHFHVAQVSLAVEKQRHRQCAGTGKTGNFKLAVHDDICDDDVFAVEIFPYRLDCFTLVGKYEDRARQSGLVMLQYRHLSSARRTPRCPEIDNDRLTAQAVKPYFLAVNVRLGRRRQ